MARASADSWPGELHLAKGALGPITGRTGKQIVAEGLKRAELKGDADPRDSVRRRIQVLINLGNDSPQLKEALLELAQENPGYRVKPENAPAYHELVRLIHSIKGRLYDDVEAGRLSSEQRSEIGAAGDVYDHGPDSVWTALDREDASAASIKAARKKLDAAWALYAKMRPGAPAPGEPSGPKPKKPRSAKPIEFSTSAVGGRTVDMPPKPRDTRRSSTTTETPMAKRKPPTSPKGRLAQAIMKGTKGLIPKGATPKQRGGVIKKANAELQCLIVADTIPSAAVIKEQLKRIVSASSFSKSSGGKKAAPKKSGGKKARAKKASGKKAAPKKSGAKKAKKPRSAKQKAATKRMQAAAKAARGGKAAPKKSAKKKDPRAAAIRGKRDGKGAVPSKQRAAAAPTMKQREIAAAFGLKGERATERQLVNLTGAGGVHVGTVTTVYYTSDKAPGTVYRHHLKKGQQPILYQDLPAYNAIAKEIGVAEQKPSTRPMKPMGGRWVELGNCEAIVVRLSTRQSKTINFGERASASDLLEGILQPVGQRPLDISGRGPMPRLLVDQDNGRLALTWYGGAMRRAPRGQRVMFLQSSRTPVVSTRGILS